jgi:hypothetical protein
MRRTMLKSMTLAAVLGVVFAAAMMLSNFRVEAEGFPSAKAAVAIDELIALGTVAPADETLGDTDWQTVLETRIKTSSQKDLVFDVALQCGIVTDTTVKSSGGNVSSATARANIAVRVLVDGDPAEPDNSIDAAGAVYAEGVVYCDRIQTLAAKFAGLNCTADLTTGAVTCADPEELQLILKTLNANAFNFAKVDVGVGVHTIKVQARAQAQVSFDGGATGSLAGAQAFAGAGSLLVEEIRLQRGTEIVDIQ